MVIIYFLELTPVGFLQNNIIYMLVKKIVMSSNNYYYILIVSVPPDVGSAKDLFTFKTVCIPIVFTKIHNKSVLSFDVLNSLNFPGACKLQSNRCLTQKRS